MKKPGQKSVVSDVRVADRAEAGPVENDQEKACRCEETASMKPRELLKLMITDLAFWKKAKK